MSSEPIRLSHSQKSSWLRCPNQFRLRRSGFPCDPSLALIGGTAWHSTCDAIDEALWLGELMTQVEITECWDANFVAGCDEARQTQPDESKWRVAGRATKDKPNKEDLAWWHLAGATFSCDYAKERLAEIDRGLDIWALPDGKPAIEVNFTIEVGGMLIRGAIDRVMSDGVSLMIRDHKTSQREPDDSSQLGIYRLAVMRLFGEAPEWGDYFMARKGQASAPTPLGHYTEGLIEREYGFFAKAKQLGIYPANPGSSCISCDVKDACAAKGGVLAEQWLSAMPS